MKVIFHTLGCRLNQAEQDSYKQALAKAGFSIVDQKDKFDIAIINTCAVTHKADRESRRAIRGLKKQNPQAKIVMTGCSNFKLPEVDYYIKDKEGFVGEFLKHFNNYVETQNLASLPDCSAKTRANIKIQTGCDNYCTYCITTHRRGDSKSFAPKKIIEQIKEKQKQDFQEIVLTGVNIGQYKYRDIDLTRLIKKILSETKIKRIRLSSINPEHVYKNSDFKDLFKDPRICQHLHLSLQSGSDKILKSMNRHYNTKQYLEIVQDYYKTFPLFGFTTDVIVGFPTETESDFNQTCSLVKECGFLKIHIFRYSQREGTPAATMPNQAPEPVKKQRAQALEKINQDLQKQFRAKIKGEELEVLFQGKRNGKWIGHAGNFLVVEKKSRQNLENKIQKIKI